MRRGLLGIVDENLQTKILSKIHRLRKLTHKRKPLAGSLIVSINSIIS